MMRSREHHRKSRNRPTFPQECGTETATTPARGKNRLCPSYPVTRENSPPTLGSYNRRSDYGLRVSVGQGFRSDYAGWFWGLPSGGPSRSGDGAEVLRAQCVLRQCGSVRAERAEASVPHPGRCVRAAWRWPPPGHPITQGRRCAPLRPSLLCLSASPRGDTESGPRPQGEQGAAPFKGGGSFQIRGYFQPTAAGK